MKLGELKPAEERISRRRVGRGMELDQDLEKHLEEDKKDKKQDLAEELEEALKVVKHHYIEDYQKEDLTILMQKLIQK